MAYKTDNRIFADVIGVFNGFLSTCGQSGWEVAQAAQPVMMGFHDKAILLSHVYTVPVGYQKGVDRDLPVSGGGYRFTHIENWLEEVRLQVTCFCVRKSTDTLDTWTAEDMAKMLKTYCNSTAGLWAFNALGYGKLRHDAVRVRSVVNDSDSYQLIASFDLVLLHEQTVESAATPATIGSLQIAGI